MRFYVYIVCLVAGALFYSTPYASSDFMSPLTFSESRILNVSVKFEGIKQSFPILGIQMNPGEESLTSEELSIRVLRLLDRVFHGHPSLRRYSHNRVVLCLGNIMINKISKDQETEEVTLHFLLPREFSI